MKKYQQLTLRVPTSLHKVIKEQADHEQTTVNQYAIYLLSLGIGKAKMFSKKKCPDCEGNGYVKAEECSTCGGSGIVFVEKISAKEETEIVSAKKILAKKESKKTVTNSRKKAG